MMGGCMAEVANLGAGDTRKFEHGTVQTAKVGTVTVSRGTMEPGWRWSSDVKPIAGTDSCMVHHKGIGVSGRLHVVMDDGTEIEVGPRGPRGPPGGRGGGPPDRPAAAACPGGPRARAFRQQDGCLEPVTRHS